MSESDRIELPVKSIHVIASGMILAGGVESVSISRAVFRELPEVKELLDALEPFATISKPEFLPTISAPIHGDDLCRARSVLEKWRPK